MASTSVISPPPNPSVEADSSDVEPIPARFRWLKRFVILAGCLLVGLVLLRWWWGFEADRRLRAEIDKYVAAGEPVYPVDFDVEVPPERNAVPLIERATEVVNAVTSSGLRIGDLWSPQTEAADSPAERKEIVQINAEALGLLRQARAREDVAWSCGVSVKCFLTGLPWSAHRQRSKLLWISAKHYYETGNHFELIETIQDSLAHDEAISARPVVIATLVAWATYGLTFATIEDVAGGVNLEGSKGDLCSDVATKPATREQVEGLIRTLLDEQAGRKAVVRVFRAERAWDLQTLDVVDRSGWGALQGRTAPGMALWDRMTLFVRRPLLVLDIVRHLRYSTIVSKAAAENTWPAAEKHLAQSALSPALLHTLTRPLTNSEHANRRTVVRVYFRYLANRRSAATALAIRLYADDHGQRPDALAQLMPEYLSDVPVDPFSVTQDTLKYDPDADYPCLYSVWEDGNDNGGVPWQTVNGRTAPENGDLPFYLDGRPPRE